MGAVLGLCSVAQVSNDTFSNVFIVINAILLVGLLLWQCRLFTMLFSVSVLSQFYLNATDVRDNVACRDHYGLYYSSTGFARFPTKGIAPSRIVGV